MQDTQQAFEGYEGEDGSTPSSLPLDLQIDEFGRTVQKPSAQDAQEIEGAPEARGPGGKVRPERRPSKKQL